jgi:hypothetical protein
MYLFEFLIKRPEIEIFANMDETLVELDLVSSKTINYRGEQYVPIKILY